MLIYGKSFDGRMRMYRLGMIAFGDDIDIDIDVIVVVVIGSCSARVQFGHRDGSFPLKIAVNRHNTFIKILWLVILIGAGEMEERRGKAGYQRLEVRHSL